MSDPLLDEFVALERAVAQRERLIRQAQCPHERTYDVTTFGGPEERLCGACGARLVVEPPD